MIYAAKVLKTDNALNVGAYNNRPLVPILAFENKAEFDAEQNRLWQGDRYEGHNLIRVKASEVRKWFPREMTICKCGEVTCNDSHYMGADRGFCCDNA